MDSEQHRRVDRRTFLKGGLIAGGVAAGAGLGIRALADTGGDSQKATPPSRRPDPAPEPPAPQQRRPNILVIMVDQLRFPQWFSAHADRHRPAPQPPAPARASGSPSQRHYTASNDCTPSRSAMLTGLYTHQTGCMITGGSTLDPGFPTWGTMLREHGYHTRWLGKWHLTHHDNHWTPGAGRSGARDATASPAASTPRPTAARARAGASTRRSRPASPSGSAPRAARNRGARRSPSSTPTTSPGGTCGATGSPAEASAAPDRPAPAAQLRDARTARRAAQAPPAALAAGNRGGLVRAGALRRPRSAADLAVLPGPLREAPARGRPARRAASCARSRASPRSPPTRSIVFTSDHGEYGASHGLRGKGAAAYEEATRVPLIVKDPRRELTRATRSAAHPAELERRPRAAAADDRDRLRASGAARATTPISPGAST